MLAGFISKLYIFFENSDNGDDDDDDEDDNDKLSSNYN